jgi:flagellar basal-body rod protein FlgC
MSVYSTALSALTAQGKALAAYASNIANAGDETPKNGSAYIPVDPVFISTEGGVAAQYVPVNPPSISVYNPDSANADENGLVSLPNIDLQDQVVGTILSKNAYAANAKVIKAQSDMDKALLDILS